MNKTQGLPFEDFIFTTEIESNYPHGILIMFGYVWTLYEKEKWYIKVEHIKTSKSLWLRVRQLDDKFFLDFVKRDTDDLDTFRILYLTEKNKSLFISVFTDKFSIDIEDKENYEKWVIQE